jgi:hypothetical protein
MVATTAGPEFEKAMRPILEAAGPLPRGRLDVTSGGSSHSRRKKRHSRQIRCACTDCSYTVHTKRKWLDLVGAPLCPKHGQMENNRQCIADMQHNRAPALVPVIRGSLAIDYSPKATLLQIIVEAIDRTLLLATAFRYAQP